MSAEDAMKEAAEAAVEESSCPKEKLRNLCMSRGYTGILALGRAFRRQDDDGSGSLSKEEIMEGLSQMGVEMEEDEIGEMIQEFDADGEGTINYEEFLAALRPEMNEDRMGVVKEAYAALDESGDGKVTLDDLKEKYNVQNHPSIEDGSETEDDVLGRFLSRLEGSTSEDGVLTENEFFDYYSGISNSIDNDEYFIEMIKKSYNL